MLLTFCLLFIGLLVSEGCILQNSKITSDITAHTGGSVLLPCYCTDLHTKPETFIWRKHNKNTFRWEEISSESGQYRDRVQLFNGHSPGNLSLLISHLTAEDGGDYRCDDSGEQYVNIRLTIQDCTLVKNEYETFIEAHTGGSALLPCYCTDLHTTLKTFTWKKYNQTGHMWEEISSESGRHTNRVQLVNGHSPGNISLLISHLTEEDGGYYRCAAEGIDHIDIRLTVEEGPSETTTPTAVAHSQTTTPTAVAHSQTTTPTAVAHSQTTTPTAVAHSQTTTPTAVVHSQTSSSTSAASSPQVSDYCTLVKNEKGSFIKAHRGGSVLLPCSCSDQHTKPESFTWKKLDTTRNTWEVISSESGQYRNRVQLFNGHSPGNLSLLISHLTVEDGGVYRCDIRAHEHINISLTVEVIGPRTAPASVDNSQTTCTLAKNVHGSIIKTHTGRSVLLPCYCNDLHKKPEKFTWQKLNSTINTWEVLSSESGQYRDRVQLVNGHSPGNLSLLISHLTEEDGGVYRCDIRAHEYIDISLTVEGCTLVNHEKVHIKISNSLYKGIHLKLHHPLQSSKVKPFQALPIPLERLM
ncbi:hypothetical protein MHYP_G00050240 [Metynnis hypsauchen]